MANCKLKISTGEILDSTEVLRRDQQKASSFVSNGRTFHLNNNLKDIVPGTYSLERLIELTTNENTPSNINEAVEMLNLLERNIQVNVQDGAYIDGSGITILDNEFGGTSINVAKYGSNRGIDLILEEAIHGVTINKLFNNPAAQQAIQRTFNQLDKRAVRAKIKEMHENGEFAPLEHMTVEEIEREVSYSLSTPAEALARTFSSFPTKLFLSKIRLDNYGEISDSPVRQSFFSQLLNTIKNFLFRGRLTEKTEDDYFKSFLGHNPEGTLEEFYQYMAGVLVEDATVSKEAEQEASRILVTRTDPGDTTAYPHAKSLKHPYDKAKVFGGYVERLFDRSGANTYEYEEYMKAKGFTLVDEDTGERYGSVEDVTDGGGIGMFRKNPTDYEDAISTADKIWGATPHTEVIDTYLGILDYNDFITKHIDNNINIILGYNLFRDAVATKWSATAIGISAALEEYASTVPDLEKGEARLRGLHKILMRYNDALGDFFDDVRQAAENEKLSGESGPANVLYDSLASKSIFVNNVVDSVSKALAADLGLNIYDDGLEANEYDRVEFFTSVVSEDLGLASEISAWAKHTDDTYSIYDFRIGKGLSIPMYTNVFKYGKNAEATEVIYDSPMNRAKLKVMLEAFMIKLNEPYAKFRNISIGHIEDSDSHLNGLMKIDIDIPGYLRMIELLIKNEHPDLYKKINSNPSTARKLFNPREYSTGSRLSRELNDEIFLSNGDFAGLLKNKIAQLNERVADHLNPNTEETAENKKAINKISKEIIELRTKLNGLDVTNINDDIGFFGLWLKQFSDSHSAVLQTFHAEYLERRRQVEKEYNDKQSQLRSYLKPLLEHYKNVNNSYMGNLTRDILLKVDHNQLYEPIVFKTRNKEGVVESWRWRTDEEMDQMLKDGANPLLDATTIKRYRALRNFIQDTYEDFMVGDDAVANRVIVSELKPNGTTKTYSNLDIHNGLLDKINTRLFKPVSKYARDTFFPTVPANKSELIGKWKEFGKEVYKRDLTFTQELHVEMANRGKYSIPMKYLGIRTDTGNFIVSDNIERQFDLFVRNMLIKDKMDDMVLTLRGINMMLESKGVPNVRAEVDRFIEQFLVGNDEGSMDKEFSKGDQLKVSAKKIPQVASSLATYSRLALNFKGAAGNAAYMGLAMWAQSARNSILNKLDFEGLTGNEYDFDDVDLRFAHKVFFEEIMPDLWKGTLHENKWYRLSKELNYLPSNSVRKTEHAKYITANMKGADISHAILPYALPELGVAMTTMIAQLNSMKMLSGKHAGRPLHSFYKMVKYKNDLGEDFSVLEWEKDENGNPIVRARRKINASGKEFYEDVTSITAEEQSRLAMVYHRYAGGYNEAERTRLPFYWLGKAFLTFRRYVPNILATGAQSSAKRIKMGHWKEIQDPNNPDNVIIEWDALASEGWGVTLYNMTKNLIALGNHIDKKEPPEGKARRFVFNMRNHFQYNENYEWENLSARQKEALVDAVITGSVWAISAVGYLLLFAEYDEDGIKIKHNSFAAKMYARVVRDLTQYWNPHEMVKLVQDPTPAGWRVAADIGLSMFDVSFNLIINHTNEDGNTPGMRQLANNLPGFSIYMRRMRFLEEMENMLEYTPDRR